MSASICPISHQSFTITPEEAALYAKMGVTQPTLHPQERTRLKMAFRNERVLYKRTCDFSKKEIISVFPAEAKIPVYDYHIWESDQWNPPMLDYDERRPFFEQFKELMQKTPHPNLIQVFNENSEYVNWVDRSKNCYVIAASSNCQDCLYSNLLIDCQDCAECTNLLNCQLCLECVDAANLYNCHYVVGSRNLTDCSFCAYSFNCQNCFGCHNLRNKQYCLFNEQYSKEDYQEKIKNYPFSSWTELQKRLNEWSEVIKNSLVKAMDLQNCQNSTGHHLKNCKNCFDCYDSNDMEDCFHVIYGSKIKDSANCYATVEHTELCHESFSVFNSRYTHFSLAAWNCQNVQYSMYCRSSQDLFGCVALKKRRYCILNKEYKPDEYATLKEKIMTNMKKSGEYGSFFPLSLSPFPYSDTIAQDYYPLTPEEIKNRGGFYVEKKEKKSAVAHYQIPDDIKDVTDNIIDQILICQKTGLTYKIIPQELNFYRKKGLALPRLSFDVRHQNRLALRQPRNLLSRNCVECSKAIMTPYEAGKQEKILCEECFLAKI